MDYFEGIVEKYIASDRETFVSPQFYFKSTANEFWIDAVAVSIRKRHVYLCEVTFSKSLSKITDKMKTYIENAEQIRAELATVAAIPTDWEMRPWLFMPKEAILRFASRWTHPVKPKLTYLENTSPWFSPNGYRSSEPGKPYPDLPIEFQ